MKIKGRRETVAVAEERIRAYIDDAARRPDIAKYLTDHRGYLKNLVNSPSFTPSYWSLYRNITMEQLVENKLQSKCTLASVDQETFEAVSTLLTATCLPDNNDRVKNATNLSYTSLKVKNVERVENPSLYLPYAEARKKLISQFFDDESGFETRCDNSLKPDTMKICNTTFGTHLLKTVNEAYLFHGTKPSNVESISENGLDNILNANALFGTGIYFAESSTKADQYAGNKLLKSKYVPGLFIQLYLLKSVNNGTL